MDKEQARFILQSFRPDGADAGSPEFAAALAVAAQDRELGDWLAGERSQDAAFAAALDHLEIPADLRASILTVLRGDHPEADFSELDAAFIGALAAARPPDGLREQIVRAMMVERAPTAAGRPEKSAPRRAGTWLKSAAVAAAIVLGAFVAFEMTSEKEPSIVDQTQTPEAKGARFGDLTLRDLETRFIHVVHDGPKLDIEEPDFVKLNEFLKSHRGPSVNGSKLPRGLGDLKTVGCQVLEVGRTTASLLCFDAADQTVHLVVVRREDLTEGEIANLARLEDVKSDHDQCRQCPVTKVSVASWGDDHNAFLLLGKIDPDKLRERFFY